MEAKTVDVSRSVAWFISGWSLFIKNPGAWIVLGIMTLAIAVVLSLIPFLGVLALSLISPVLGAGLMYAAREADAGRALDVLYLFQGFRERDKLTPLLSLGGVALAGLIIGLVIAFLLAGGSMVTMMMSGGDRHALTAGALGGFMLAGLVILVVEVVVTMAVVYAIPLVMFRGVPAGEALRSSLNANLRNLLPLLVFGVIYLFVAVLATLPLMLGWIVLLPVSIATVYLSYKDLYEAA